MSQTPQVLPTPTVELTDILRTLAMCFERGQVTELRALEVSTTKQPRPHVVSGYFDDLDRLADAAEKVARYAKGVYVVPNVVDPALLARAANRVRRVEREPTTADANIVRRRWLLIDVDPVRAAGISSTDAEHAAGLQRVQDVRAMLTAAGWPDGALADSGNGGHLLYRLDLPNDDASRTLLEHVLQALAFRFDDATAMLDQKVFNAARIWKLYGTVARKGDHTADRPHRVSRLLEVPETWTEVTLAQLQAVAQQRPEPPRAPTSTRRRAESRGAPFDLDQWIAAHGLDLIGPSPWQGGRKWIFRVCPWHDEHRNRSAFIVQQANGAIGAGCHHNGCAGKDWQALRDLVEPDRRTRGRSSRAEPPKAGSAASNGTAAVAADTPQEDTPLSDQFNAEALVQAHGADLRYCERWKSWLIFDGQRWVIDETGQVMRWAKQTVKELGARLPQIHGAAETKAFLAHLQRSLSRRSLDAMVQLTQSEPGIAVTPEAFDRDPMLFNVQNGTLDLRTATLQPHHREDLLMKISPVPYLEDATCPRWVKFLGEIYAGDRDLIAFDQKSTGYTMTGETREQVVFICEGSGTNGKSTKLSIMREIMGEGEYALRTNLKAFTESTAHHQPASIEYYIAKLQHVRFAYASEGEEGARLSEALIKDVTGGVDFITGRHPYGQPFSFRPRFKLWLGTNHEPVIRGTDPAIWRRPRKIPFTVSFEGREDKDLFTALCEELPGILRWAVKGCLWWQMHGLEPPAAVKDATTAYRHSMDVVGRFIEESCTLNKTLKIESTALYNAYQKWCEDSGETAISQRKLAGQLKERGLRNDTLSPITNRVMWTGIGLRIAGGTTS